MPLYVPSSGVAGGLTPIETITFSGSTNTAITGAFPAGYREILVKALLIKDTATSAQLQVQANSDATTSKYGFSQTGGSGTAINAQQTPGTSGFWQGLNVGSAGTIATSVSYFDFIIPDYTNTTLGKSIKVSNTSLAGNASGGNLYLDAVMNWFSTDAISTLRFTLASGNFTANSVIKVYGVS